MDFKYFKIFSIKMITSSERHVCDESTEFHEVDEKGNIIEYSIEDVEKELNIMDDKYKIISVDTSHNELDGFIKNYVLYKAIREKFCFSKDADKIREFNNVKFLKNSCSEEIIKKEDIKGCSIDKIMFFKIA